MTDAVAEEYLRFAERQAHGQSPVFEAWARGVAADPEARARIATLPPEKRQPNLVFAATRWHGVSPGPYAVLRAALSERWDALVPTILARATQTNEPRRCATLLPFLAELPGPLALVEVGASAGLTLLPDRYSYRYLLDDGTVVALDPAEGPSELVLECRLRGIRPPDRMPTVVWRAGIDLEPVDVHDPDASAWLENLVWPEHDDRRASLRAALAIARREPVPIVRADLLDALPGVVGDAPAGATVVVYHSAVLAYLDEDERRRFRELVESLDVRWISNEAPTALPEIARLAGPAPDEALLMLTALDGRPVGWAHGHGRSLTAISWTPAGRSPREPPSATATGR